jgi:hemoglobin
MITGRRQGAIMHDRATRVRVAVMRPSLYEFAGGEAAFLALAAAHHARCLADPESNHPFSHPDQHPQHVERPAAYWAEALGGPPRYSTECGSHAGVVHLHCGNGDLSDLNRRFLAGFVAAMDDVGLPEDADFRASMRDYMVWATGEISARPDDAPDVGEGSLVPHWSWDGLRMPGTDPGAVSFRRGRA